MVEVTKDERVRQRLSFYNANEERLLELVLRAEKKQLADGIKRSVICIDVDDAAWTSLVEALMPNENWQAFRDKGQVPVARGIIPREIAEDALASCEPVSPLPTERVVVLVCAAGGISVFYGPFTFPVAHG